MALSIAICPSTPLLVPELGGEAAQETAELREAAIIAVRSLPTQWIAIGACRVYTCDAAVEQVDVEISGVAVS